jgi:hypothetical protein
MENLVIPYTWLHGQNHHIREVVVTMEQVENKKEMAPTAEIPGMKNLRGIAHGNRDLLRPCRVCVGLRSSLVDYFLGSRQLRSNIAQKVNDAACVRLPVCVNRRIREANPGRSAQA